MKRCGSGFVAGARGPHAEVPMCAGLELELWNAEVRPTGWAEVRTPAKGVERRTNPKPEPPPPAPPTVLRPALALPRSSGPGPLLPPGPRALQLVAQRRLLPPAALQTPPPQGAPGPRREPEPGNAGPRRGASGGPDGAGSRAGRTRGGPAGRGTSGRRGVPGAVGPGNGCSRRAPSRPGLEGTVAAPFAGRAEPGGRSGGDRVGRGRGPGLARGRPGRAPPAPSGRAPAVQRGSGAVPAQSPRRAAPRPAPASARLRVTSRPPIGPRGLGGGVGSGELTAAPRHWSGRRTRAVAGRPRYPEPRESFQLRRVELSGRGAGPGRAGPGGAREPVSGGSAQA